MIDLDYWPTPSGWKISIRPNNRVPALVDHDPLDHGDRLALFESGAAQ